jgi:[protein-PII] uridylyltransferase
VVIYAPDRAGLAADLARCFTNMGANVVGAQVFTSETHQALDVFYIQDAEAKPFGHDDPKRLKALERALEKAALDGALPPLEHVSLSNRTAVFAIAPTVVFDDDTRRRNTIIEVSGRDRPGLLADLVSVLNKAKLDISSAHIDCYGERAVDAFYVVDRKTLEPLSRTQKEKIKRSFIDVLAQAPTLQPSTASKPSLARARASTAR